MSDTNNKIEPRLLKGFRDYGPLQQFNRQQVFSIIQSVFERFGFLPLSTPVLEYKEILMGKYGDDEKLVYSFKDNGDRDVAMRYDLTVPLARYVAQNQNQLTFPFKRYQIAPVWRADNPQKGRLREFYQCDVDAVGTDSPLADAEVIACICAALDELKVTDYEVRLNNREVFRDFSAETIRSIDKVDKIGIEGVLVELAEKNVNEDEIQRAKTLLNNNNSQVPESVRKVIDYLNSFNLKGSIVFSSSIARGIDYYTGTVFEIYLTNYPGYPAISAGGRYDGLLDQFSDKPLSAVGASLGVDRVLEILDAEASKIVKDKIEVIKALILNQNESLQNDYIKLATELRAQGVNVELYYTPTKLDKQFKYAESKNIPYAIIIGEEEAKAGKAQLKNLQTREQVELLQTEIVENLH